VPQLVYLLAGVMILVLSYLERPMESTIALITVMAGIPAYYYFKSTVRRE